MALSDRVLYSTMIVGANAEILTSITSNLTTSNFQQHRLAIQGNGAGPIYLAQVQFDVDNTGANEVQKGKPPDLPAAFFPLWSFLGEQAFFIRAPAPADNL